MELLPRRRPKSCSVIGANLSLAFLLTLLLLLAPPADSFAVPSRRSLFHNTHSSTSLYAAKKKKRKDSGSFVNRVARRNYEVIESIEAGISLKGTEVKAIRDGKLNLRDGYVRPSQDSRGMTLFNVHIGKHSQAGAYFQHEERRPRPLLVHKSQSRKWAQQVERSGMTIVPMKAYFNDDNRFKLQIALCRGKNVRDKRATIKERDIKRETSRIMKSFRV